MKKMTFLQWGFLVEIYQAEEPVHKSSLKDQRMLESCIKKGYLESVEDEMVIITNYGKEAAARDITPLVRYKLDERLIEKRHQVSEKDLDTSNKTSVPTRPKVEDFDSVELANLIDEFVRAKGLSLEDSIEDVIETLKGEG